MAHIFVKRLGSRAWIKFDTDFDSSIHRIDATIDWNLAQQQTTYQYGRSTHYHDLDI